MMFEEEFVWIVGFDVIIYFNFFVVGGFLMSLLD